MLNFKKTLILSMLVTLPMQVTATSNPAMVPIISYLLSDSSSTVVIPPNPSQTNHAPRVICNQQRAYDDKIVLYRGGVRDISFTPIDDDGDEIVSYTITKQPSYARIDGSGKNKTMVSTDTRYTGDDYFEIKVNDGTIDSQATRFIISINRNYSGQRVPTSYSRNLTVLKNTSKEFEIAGLDGDGEAITYRVIEQPSHGSISGTPPHLTYTPHSGFAGTDRMTFKVNDGIDDSLEASVRIEVYKNSYYTLKKTDQTQSWDDDGNLDSNIKDDGFYEKGVPLEFTRDNTKKIVHDHITGLMWQDDVFVAKVWMTDEKHTICKGDSDNYYNSYSSLCDDTSGDTAATYCSNLSLGGYRDWRVPTMLELDTVINSKTQSHFFSAFQQTKGGYFWSATTYSALGDGEFAYALKSCIGGQGGRYNKNYKTHGAVKCVRDAE